MVFLDENYHDREDVWDADERRFFNPRVPRVSASNILVAATPR
jgi:hypothetical protein